MFMSVLERCCRVDSMGAGSGSRGRYTLFCWLVVWFDERKEARLELFNPKKY